MNLLSFILILIGVTAIKAEVDCRRHPPHLRFGTCCELSNLISEDAKEKCAGQDLNGDHLHRHHEHPHELSDHGPHRMHGGPHKFGPHKHCFLSCVVNVTGILVDGELQENVLISYLDELFGDAEKIEFLSNKFKICHEKQKDLETKRTEHRNASHHCGSKENGMLIGCVHMQAFIDCPVEFWSNTNECNEARDHFIQCWPPFKNSDDQDGNPGGIEEEAEEI